MGSPNTSAIVRIPDPTKSERTAAVTLESFASTVDKADGVSLATLSPLDTIVVRTRNSVYRIHLLDPQNGEALIMGGAFFPTTTRGVVAGATFGGSMLKRGVVLYGCSLEICANAQRITTTRVKDIQLNPRDAHVS